MRHAGFEGDYILLYQCGLIERHPLPRLAAGLPTRLYNVRMVRGGSH
jgi:hypothetical protein